MNIDTLNAHCGPWFFYCPRLAQGRLIYHLEIFFSSIGLFVRLFLDVRGFKIFLLKVFNWTFLTLGNLFLGYYRLSLYSFLFKL